MDLGLGGKVAIITGGGEGIGRAAAHRIAAEGGAVAIVGRRGEVLERAAAEIGAATGGTVLPLRADITQDGAPASVVKQTLERFGRLDILVNNAGVSMAKPFEQVSVADWRADFELKVWAAMEFCRLAIPEMRRQGGGRIVNVTNLDGRTPSKGKMPTSIARAAGIAFTKGLSKDLAADNILVNTVCIGFIKSGQHERKVERMAAEGGDGDLDAFYRAEAGRRGVPLGRVGESEEAGDVIAFLVSARASYLTGIAVNIDGGLSPVV